MNHYFPHEKLDVYGVALRFTSLAEDLLAPMALVDVEHVKEYLRDVMAMLSGLRGYLDE